MSKLWSLVLLRSLAANVTHTRTHTNTHLGSFRFKTPKWPAAKWTAMIVYLVYFLYLIFGLFSAQRTFVCFFDWRTPYFNVDNNCHWLLLLQADMDHLMKPRQRSFCFVPFLFVLTDPEITRAQNRFDIARACRSHLFHSPRIRGDEWWMKCVHLLRYDGNSFMYSDRILCLLLTRNNFHRMIMKSRRYSHLLLGIIRNLHFI